tara:strand:+ start:521 stop:1189 length:669 start_codon:yes stop_codon:yes gene_type:complete
MQQLRKYIRHLIVESSGNIKIDNIISIIDGFGAGIKIVPNEKSGRIDIVYCEKPTSKKEPDDFFFDESHLTDRAKAYYKKNKLDLEDLVGALTIMKMTNSDIRNYGNCNGAYKVDIIESPAGFGPLLYEVALEYLYNYRSKNGLIPDRRSVKPEAANVWKVYNSKRDDVKKIQLHPDDCDMEVAGGKLKYKKSELSKMYVKDNMNAITMLKKRKMLYISPKL